MTLQMSPKKPRSIMRSLLLFAGAQSVLVIIVALILSQFIWTDAESARAIHSSAWLAVGVQLLTFAVARLVAQQQVMAGWGLGVLLRFVVVMAWAFLGIKALGLALVPALLSLVMFFFVSTLVEPVFLNS